MIRGWFPKVGFSPKMDGENNQKLPMKKWMIWGENPPFKETPEIHRCSVSFCSYIFWRGTPGIRLGPPRWLHGYILPFTKDASHHQNPCLNPSYTFICHWPTGVFWSSVSSFFFVLDPWDWSGICTYMKTIDF